MDKTICNNQWALHNIWHTSSLFMEQNISWVSSELSFGNMLVQLRVIFKHPMLLCVPEVIFSFWHFQHSCFKLPFLIQEITYCFCRLCYLTRNFFQDNIYLQAVLILFQVLDSWAQKKNSTVTNSRIASVQQQKP